MLFNLMSCPPRLSQDLFVLHAREQFFLTLGLHTVLLSSSTCDGLLFRDFIRGDRGDSAGAVSANAFFFLLRACGEGAVAAQERRAAQQSLLPHARFDSECVNLEHVLFDLFSHFTLGEIRWSLSAHV